jgi:chromosomal replication initiation ATPase DnaA
MNYNLTGQMHSARTITRAAENRIKNLTGIKVNLLACPDYHRNKTPEQLLRIVAAALNMNFADYRKKSRQRNVVELRFIAAHLLTVFFPGITLVQISVGFGGQHHTSIMNGLEKVKILLAAGDESFTAKYETALKSVNKWIRKEMLEYASAISA